ncbi:MAG: hypothetical protein JSS98_03455 [Bacteroidetes bacterium]|nr:hypothetical protein [Bacteroidota bacterium]
MYLKKITFSTLLLLFSCSVFTVLAQNNLPLKYKRSTVYAGIEVGSKGVKMSLVELAKKVTDENSFNILKDTSVNTDFISFSPVTFSATLNALYGLYETGLTKYNIPTGRIFTVVSSGVKVIADKEEKDQWITNLIDSFKLRVNDKARMVDVISPEEEARLSHLGIVPESKRYTTFLIDIGSGNTKGGYFPNMNTDNIKLFNLSWGTKSISNATEKRMDDDKSMDNFYKQLQRVLTGDADKEITYAVNVSGAYNMSDNVAFSGGAAWATATLMFPDLINDPVITVTYEQVENFNKKLFEDYDSYSEKSILKELSKDNPDRDAIASAVKTVNKVFDQKAMLSGSGLLLKIMRQFEGIKERKQFYLVKNGQVGWISAYVGKNSGR